MTASSQGQNCNYEQEQDGVKWFPSRYVHSCQGVIAGALENLFKQSVDLADLPVIEALEIREVLL